jgi:hypothetical protein
MDGIDIKTVRVITSEYAIKYFRHLPLLMTKIIQYSMYSTPSDSRIEYIVHTWRDHVLMSLGVNVISGNTLK